jgi:hypothetical protein
MKLSPEQQKKWLYWSNLLFAAVFAAYILQWVIRGIQR